MATLKPAALTPAHREALAPAARLLLDRLASEPWAEDLYLAGSAALALYVGHRPVTDLDLMGGTNRLRSAERRDILRALLAFDPETEVEAARDGYLFARIGGVGLRLFYYPYPLVDPQEELGGPGGLAVASAADLGLMKLAAIVSRGNRRDFVDLFVLCRELPLPELLARAEDKFGHVRDFPLLALKGLADRSQVANDPMPRLAAPLAWDEVEAWLDGPVRALARERIGLPPPSTDAAGGSLSR